MSNRLVAILGVIIILLFTTQFIFAPLGGSQKIKYLDANSKYKKGLGTKKKPFKNLQYAIDHCKDGDTLFILPGEYQSTAHTFIENLCGNCELHNTTVKASRGFIIEGKRLTIIGAGTDKVKLFTNAGYGIIFLNSRGSSITGVTITGGIRDPDKNATDAAIVVKFSSVEIKGCNIENNNEIIDEVVVGIAGIVGREGSHLYIAENQLINNSWDGIALYRGANAFIIDNVIKKGRGVGIGITWDAYAIISGNEISEYWKGIGSFGDSRVILRNNIVRDCLGWGIVAAGNSFMDACNNVVHHNGNCGMASWGENTSGRFSNNIISLNGWKEQWVTPRVGIQNYGGIQNFIVSHNCLWKNEAGNYNNMENLTGKFGNIEADPRFKNPPIGDFSLNQDSPCINAGNPAISDNDGSISDIGLMKEVK